MPRPRLVKWFFVAKSDAMTDAPAFGPAPARIRIIAHAESIDAATSISMTRARVAGP